MSEITVNASDGGSFMAYVAEPASGSGPGVLVAQEIFGVNVVMRGICDDLAAQGYVAVCPDLFWRQQPGIQITDQTDEEWQQAFKLYQGFDEDKGVDDLKATLAAMRGMEACAGKVGSVGYCLGGKLAYLMATRSDADCNVCYYGVGIEAALDEAGNIDEPLLMHIAEEDGFVDKPTQARIKQGLADNPLITIHDYPGVDHAFARTEGVNWNPEAATLANSRTAAFLKQHLG
ncbi:MAG: dienelactone hydrolase family protein [Kiloniellales bacterium]